MYYKIFAIIFLASELIQAMDRTDKEISPFKIKIINNSGFSVLMLRQNQNRLHDRSVVCISNSEYEGNTFNFNMNKLTEKNDQYAIRTPDKIYILNFEKKPTYFKAILERMKVLPGTPFPMTSVDIFNFTNYIEREPIQEIEDLTIGNTLIINLKQTSANLERVESE